MATGCVERCEAPTTLAVAELDDTGRPTYRFYVDGTSAPAFDSTFGDLVPTILFTGGLALVLEPMARHRRGMIVAARRRVAR